uniref:UPF0725 protein n=2 Tax=Noccaea caerulescens TaxID=107243 RepID=A0A1J3HGC5_NOCCA
MSGEREALLRLMWHMFPTKEEFDRRTREYEEGVDKSEGFDVSGLTAPPLSPALLEIICSNGTCSRLIVLYARMGLHRYNMLQGTNLELISVKKYNKSTWSAACLYYITLEAMDPATNSPLTFQTKVQELKYGQMDLTCGIARPLGDIKRSSENSKRCRLLEKSEVQENNDWIRLYLELAIATTNRSRVENHDLSDLKIVKVAVDTSKQDVEEGLEDSKLFAIVYITYKDSWEDARLGKQHAVDRLAIVRRAFDEFYGSFTLVGQTREIIPKKKLRTKQLGFTKMWRRLYTPRRLKAYKDGLSRRVHKKRSMTGPNAL